MTLRGLLSSLLVVPLLGPVQALAGEPLNELRPGLQALRQGELARLERALGPLAEQPLYRADLTIDVAARRIVGQVAVRWTVRGEPLVEVTLRTAPNEAHPDAVMLLSATVNGQPAVLEHPDPTRTRVKLPAEALAGTVVELGVRLEARVPPLPASGVAVADHAAFSAAPDFMSLVGLLPMVSPSPSNFLVSVSVPRGFTVVMPGIALGEVPDQRTRVRFTNGVVGSRAFPFFVTRGLEKLSADARGIAVEAWVTRGEPRSKLVLDHAVFAARELDRVLGPYPFKTLRLVEVPLTGGVGGMAFPGLVTVSTTLVSSTTAPAAALGLASMEDPEVLEFYGPTLEHQLQSLLEFTVFRQISAQYAGCLVGSDLLDDPAALEPLAQHLALLLFELRHGKKAADKVRESQVKMAYWLWRMVGGADTAASRPTVAFTSPAHFAGIVAGKAPLLFDAQRKLVGEDVWEKTLQAYVERSRYRRATSNTVTELAAARSPAHARQLERLRKHWLEELHGDEDVGQRNLAELFKGGLMPQANQLDPRSLSAFEALLAQYLAGRR
ncbi:MAG: hypothetical protein Q8S33_27605 [Myxococcales bacterium]|nr:hypothetical protein [Myxococcales bacterium]